MTPLEHRSTTRIVKGGWGGTEPLPVTDISGGKAIAIMPSEHERAELADRNAFLSLVILDDGSISMRVGTSEVASEN